MDVVRCARLSVTSAAKRGGRGLQAARVMRAVSKKRLLACRQNDNFVV